MDQNKIGRFIAECRKNKNYTQEQLGDLLNITRKAVSKWECGTAMPDVSLWHELCEILDITADELLSGERIEPTKKQIPHDKTIIKLGYFIQKSRLQTKIFMSLAGVLLITLLTLLSMFFFSNFDTVRVYSIAGSNEDLVVNGLLKHYRDYNLLTIYNIELVGEDAQIYGIHKRLLTKEGFVLYQRGDIHFREIHHDGAPLKLSHRLSEASIVIREDLDNEIVVLTHACEKDLILEIGYINTNNEILTREVTLNFNMEYSNTRIFYR